MGFTNVRPVDEQLARGVGHQALLDEAPVAVLVVNPATQEVTWSTRGAQILLGLSAQELLGLNLKRLLAPSEPSGQDLQQRLQDGVISMPGLHQRDGKAVPLRLVIRAARLEGQESWIVALQDVTELLQLRDDLAASQERFVLVGKATRDLVWDWDMTSDRLSFGGAGAPLGYEPAELSGPLDHWTQRVHPEDRQHIMQTLHEAVEHRHRQWQGEYRFRRKDGSYAYILDRGFIVLDHEGKPCRMLGAMADVTPLMESREALRRLSEVTRQVAEQRQARLRELRRELAQVEQRERRRLAQVLHDHLQQLLVAAKMRLEQATQQIESPPTCDLNRQAISLVSQAIQEARSLSTELYPSVLNQDSGLTLSLNWLAAWMRDKHDLQVNLDVREPYRPSAPQTRVALFHAVRELLFNVVKHAGVRQATVNVWPEQDAVVAQVIDFGRGFDEQQALAEPQADNGVRNGFGLAHLRRRMELIGGEIFIHSVPGQGTRITLRLPMDEPSTDIDGK